MGKVLAPSVEAMLPWMDRERERRERGREGREIYNEIERDCHSDFGSIAESCLIGWWRGGGQLQEARQSLLEGSFCKIVRLSWLRRSECQMYCWVQCPWVFIVFLGMTLDTAETPFAKTLSYLPRGSFHWPIWCWRSLLHSWRAIESEASERRQACI